MKRINNYLKAHHGILKKMVQMQLLPHNTRKEALNDILRQWVLNK